MRACKSFDETWKIQRACIENFCKTSVQHAKFSKTSKKFTKLYKTCSGILGNFLNLQYLTEIMNNVHGKFLKITEINFQMSFFLKNKILEKLITETCKVLYSAKKMHRLLTKYIEFFFKTSMLQSCCSA